MTANPRFKVVHTDTPDLQQFAVEQQLLAEFGAELVATDAVDENDLMAAVHDADALLVNRAAITRRLIEQMPRCQVVVRKGVGYDSVDVDAATEHGVLVCTLPDIWTDEVANHALALMLALNRRLLPLDRRLRSGGWRSFKQEHMGSVTGETVGIVGYGRIGSAFGRRVTALGPAVIYYDPYIAAPPGRESGIERVHSLEELLRRSDYVSIHTPLTPETQHMFSDEQFRQMKPTAYLINTARGPVVNQQALVRALREGQIAGAGIDAFEQEPPALNDPLLQLDSVILTPHNAFYSDPAVARMHVRAAQEVIETLSGNWPPGLLNTELRRRGQRRQPIAAQSAD